MRACARVRDTAAAPSCSLTWKAWPTRITRCGVVALIDTDSLVTYGEAPAKYSSHEGHGDHGGYDPYFLVGALGRP